MRSGVTQTEEKNLHAFALRSTVLPRTTEFVVLADDASDRISRFATTQSVMREESRVADFLQPPYTIVGFVGLSQLVRPWANPDGRSRRTLLEQHRDRRDAETTLQCVSCVQVNLRERGRNIVQVRSRRASRARDIHLGEASEHLLRVPAPWLCFWRMLLSQGRSRSELSGLQVASQTAFTKRFVGKPKDC